MNKIEIDLSEYMNVNAPLCAVCDQKCTGPEKESICYEEYLKNARERFGKSSIPVCYTCWRRRCEKCEKCCIPLNFAFSNSLGAIIMHKTTLVYTHKKFDHICVHCAEETL